MMSTLIGTTWRHKKRGTTYRVVACTFVDLTGLVDGDAAVFWAVFRYPKRVLFGVSREMPAANLPLVMAIPIRLQIAPPRTLEVVVIYQAAVDNTIWGRPETEFLDGRFEKIAP